MPCLHPAPEQPHLLLVVRDDAADEVGVGVPQRGHQLGQLLLVELPDSAEHALPRLEGPGQCCLRHAGHLVQADDAVHCRDRGRGCEHPEDTVGQERDRHLDRIRRETTEQQGPFCLQSIHSHLHMLTL